MRAIKFRAWHKTEKKMYTVGSLYFADDQIAVWIYDSPPAIDPDTLTRYCASDEVELMQFTGLHDASGREIYEGDILGMDDPTDTSRAVVVFHEGAFKPQLCVQWDSPIFDNDWDDWEVIGNRWEHPELMQKDGEA